MASQFHGRACQVVDEVRRRMNAFGWDKDKQGPMEDTLQAALGFYYDSDVDWSDLNDYPHKPQTPQNHPSAWWGAVSPGGAAALVYRYMHT